MLRRIAPPIALSLGCLVSLLLLPFAIADDAPPPRARDVIVRGKTELVEALEAALAGREGRLADGRSVTFVLDVTPYTKRASRSLGNALVALGERTPGAHAWRLGLIGGEVGRAVPSLGLLRALLPALLGRTTDGVNTLRDLRRTIETIPGDGGLVVYLADWRFEDDHDLENFARYLRRRRLTLSVVGSEAAWERGWNDGTPDIRDVMAGDFHPKYQEHIGRSPFGPGEAEAPWHGGETAYPILPYRYGSTFWRTEFSRGLDDDEGFEGILGRLRGEDGKPPSREDLAERLRGRLDRQVRSSGGGQAYPLPSAFGPYALMRAAGLTGGRYVLWSWNPGGRALVKYDWARCDLFPPDLRPRRAILADLRSDDRAGPILRAWHDVLELGTDLIAHTPPVKKNGRTPQEMENATEPPMLAWQWPTRSDRRTFVKEAKTLYAALGRIVDRMQKAAFEQGEVASDRARRLEADARHLHHVLAVLRFQLGEAIAVAEDVPDSAWDDDERAPGLAPRDWILPGRDPADIRTRGEPRQREEGEAVKQARARHLEQFRGTPFGEQVALNAVRTFDLVFLETMDPSDLAPGRSPAESGGETPEPTEPERPVTPRGPGGGSSGGGPSSGR